MLVALGFEPVWAAIVALVANTAPVAFGAMGTLAVTLAPIGLVDGRRQLKGPREARR